MAVVAVRISALVGAAISQSTIQEPEILDCCLR
jgi:hypothetical protein